MSAFFVGPDHVNAILTTLHSMRRDFSFTLPGTGYKEASDTSALTAAGKLLLAENIESLQARYPSDLEDFDVSSFRFEYDFHFATRSDRAIATIKLCESLAYQSCEHDGWSESWACKFLEQVKSSQVSLFPGYEAAPWAYDRRDPRCGGGERKIAEVVA